MERLQDDVHEGASGGLKPYIKFRKKFVKYELEEAGVVAWFVVGSSVTGSMSVFTDGINCRSEGICCQITSRLTQRGELCSVGLSLSLQMPLILRRLLGVLALMSPLEDATDLLDVIRTGR